MRFHDGTRFNAAAVCANFNRWYNFSGPFRDASATYYYQSIFGGFKGQPKALFRSCRTAGPLRVVITLARRNGPFLPSLVLSAFAMQSPTAMRRYGANEGTLQNGVFRPTGTYAFRHPTGIGPYMLERWTVGQSVVLRRNPRYWGTRARLAWIIIRPIADNTARVQALQNGEVFAMDLLAPQFVGTVRGNRRLKVLSRPAFNVAYVTINQSKPPMNNKLVRQAVAHGLDRAGVVNSFYAGRGVVATQFMPPEVKGYAEDVPKYTYDPDRARQLLQEAGLTPPVKVTFWYPSDVSRPYMPDPKRNFEAFKASLEQSGFKVTPKTAPWSPDYLGGVDEGNAQVYLLGWTGDFGDPDNFIGTFFQTPQKAWGTTAKPNKEVTDLLDQAEVETDEDARRDIYEDANRAIMEWLPGVPYAHTEPALAFAANVQGYEPSPTSNESFAPVSIEE